MRYLAAFPQGGEGGGGCLGIHPSGDKGATVPLILDIIHGVIGFEPDHLIRSELRRQCSDLLVEVGNLSGPRYGEDIASLTVNLSYCKL